MARYDGTDWIKVVNLVGGGGSIVPTRTVLADSVGVSNTAGPHEITLTEAITERQLLTIFIFTSGAANPDGIGYLLSDDLLALTAEATTPTDAENALSVVTASYSASSFTQQSGNYFIYRKDDSTIMGSSHSFSGTFTDHHSYATWRRRLHRRATISIRPDTR